MDPRFGSTRVGSTRARLAVIVGAALPATLFSSGAGQSSVGERLRGLDTSLAFVPADAAVAHAMVQYGDVP